MLMSWSKNFLRHQENKIPADQILPNFKNFKDNNWKNIDSNDNKVFLDFLKDHISAAKITFLGGDL